MDHGQTVVTIAGHVVVSLAIWREYDMDRYKTLIFVRRVTLP